MKRKAGGIDATLRDAIRKSGESCYAIAKRAGIAPDVVLRFVAGRDIRISTTAKIAEALDLELVKRSK
jgi:hypothetical protein